MVREPTRDEDEKAAAMVYVGDEGELIKPMVMGALVIEI